MNSTLKLVSWTIAPLMLSLSIVSFISDSNNLVTFAAAAKQQAQKTIQDEKTNQSNPVLQRANQLLQQGIEQADNNRFTVAVQLWQQALRLYQQIQNREREAQTVVLLSSALIDLGELPRGIQSAQQGLKLAQQLELPELEAVTLVNLANAYVKQNQPEVAIRYAQKGMEIARKLKLLSSQAWALVWLSEAYSMQGNMPKAIAHSEQALLISRRIQNPLLEGIANINTGIFSLRVTNFSKARQYLEHGLILAQKIQNPGLKGIALTNLGAMFNAQGENRKAIAFAQQALKLGQQFRNSIVTIEALHVLTYSHLSQEDSEKAINYAQQWLSIAQQSNLLPAQARSLAALGAAYLQQGQPRAAIANLEKGLAIARQSRDSVAEGLILARLGSAYTLEGNLQQGLQSAQQALKLSDRIQDRSIEVQGFLTLATVYLLLGNDASSAMYAIRAQVANQRLKEPAFEAIALNLLAVGLSKSGQSDVNTSIRYATQSLKIAERIGRPKLQLQALRTLALGFFAKGEPQQGFATLEQRLKVAQQINASLEEGFSLTMLAGAHINHGDLNQALNYAQQGLAIARQINNRGIEESALSSLGIIFAEKGQNTEAEAALKAALAITESQQGGLPDLEKISFLDRNRNSYATLQRVLVAQNKAESALEVAEQGRARAFADRLTAQLQPNSQPVLELTKTTPNLEHIRQIAKAHKATLVQYSVLYGDRGSKWNDAVFIWVVKPTGKVSFRQVNLKVLNQSLGSFVNTTRIALGSRGRSDIGLVLTEEVIRQAKGQQSQHLHELHQLLIAPIADLLPQNPSDLVIFIPQDELFLVPFPALRDANGQYLIQKHTMQTAPSIQVLGLTQQMKQKQQTAISGESQNSVLVVGNPITPKIWLNSDHPPIELDDLPSAKREAIAIANLFKTQPIIGDQATEPEVVRRMATARLIHLATHGLLNEYATLPGAIVLAPVTGKVNQHPFSNPRIDDGLLITEELLKMKLNAELVVLSACDTGRGRITGDGVIGLSRSLISTGVPSVIVSLWAVPDAPTAELMTEFYENWKQRNLDKAQALRQAMLTTMKTHPNPRDWAAFTLIGEAE